jgi:hypothetical protein
MIIFAKFPNNIIDKLKSESSKLALLLPFTKRSGLIYLNNKVKTPSNLLITTPIISKNNANGYKKKTDTKRFNVVATECFLNSPFA